jgi:phosphate starvation-inducible PhoH-like protein
MSSKKNFRTGLLLGNIELTPKQQKFFKIMTEKKTKVVFLSGPAGTSKTFLAVYAALHLFNEDSKNIKINYLRTVVESSERSLGFLKGSIDEKFDPYMRPLVDKIGEILNEKETSFLTTNNALSAAPINFIRGQDWKNQIVIADEMQNATIKELTTILTRINSNTKIFICGDEFQSDIRNTGFSKICKTFEAEEASSHGVYSLRFEKEDIMRDPVVAYVLEKIENIIN